MFKVRIRWGSSEPTEPFEYEFKTVEERDAFLYGVDEGNGWMDYEIVEDDETTDGEQTEIGVMQS